MISIALKTPLEIRLGICIYKTSLRHRPDDYVGFIPSCPPHILQQNCAHALDGTQLVVLGGLGWSRHTCIPKGFMHYRDHFISTSCFLDWKLFNFVLRAAIAYRYCTIKSHNGKSLWREYKFQKILQCEFVTSRWNLLRLQSRLHPCIHDATGQRDAAEQIAADRLLTSFPRRHFWSGYLLVFSEALLISALLQ